MGLLVSCHSHVHGGEALLSDGSQQSSAVAVVDLSTSKGLPWVDYLCMYVCVCVCLIVNCTIHV